MARHLFLTLTAALMAMAAGCAHCDTCDDFPAPANVAYGAPIPTSGEAGPILAPAPPLSIGSEFSGMPADVTGAAHMAVPHYQSAPSPPSLPQLPNASGSDVKKVPDEPLPQLPEEPKTGAGARTGETPKTDGGADAGTGATPKSDKNGEITKPIVPIP